MFTDIVEYLYNNRIATIKAAPKDKFLPRISYKNGEVMLLDEKKSDATTSNTDGKCEADHCDNNDEIANCANNSDNERNDCETATCTNNSGSS